MAGKFRVSGALFENDKGGPAFTGFVEIDGVKTNIALWPKRSAKGNDYLQVSEDMKKSVQAPSAPQIGSPFKKRQPAPNPNLRGSGTKDDPDDPFGDGGDAIPF